MAVSAAASRQASTLRLRLEGLAVLVGLIAIIAVLIGMATAPLRAVNAEIAAVESRMAGFEASVRNAAVPAPVNLAPILADADAEAHSAVIQRWITRDADAAGLRVERLSPAALNSREAGVTAISFSLDARGDLEAWTGFLTKLAARRPALFLERMQVTASGVRRRDDRLAITVSLTGYALDELSP